ncbi:alpha/beta hydrolase [Ferrimonas pelagia]|uniref:Alpha/beta hydrolase n=1 Tax=Ferrimonas pelagia TaxID=1177826 RepID=A0ABP9EVY5_9GAMM
MTAAVYGEWTLAELEREYSPSSCIEDIGYYLDRYATLSAAARKGGDGKLLLDCRYGDKPRQCLDLYLPRQQAPAPLHIYIHGGYWQQLSKDESAFAAPMLNAQGVGLAVLNYTLAPQASLTEIVAEIRQAIVWCYQQAPGVDRRNITLSGSSAGAHLVMMMSLTDWTQYGLPAEPFAGALAVSGIYDLAPLVPTYINEAVQLSPQEVASLSPMVQPLSVSCPLLLAFGEIETAEFKRQSRDYYQRLSEAGLTVELASIPRRNHFDVILELTDADSLLSRRLLGWISP